MAKTYSVKKKITWLGLDFGSSSTKAVGIVGATGERVEFLFDPGYYPDGRIKTALKKSGDGFTLTTVVDIGKEGWDYCIKENAVNPDGREKIKAFVIKYLHALAGKEGGGFPKYDFDSVEAVCFGAPAYYKLKKEGNYLENYKSYVTEAIEESGVFGRCPRIISCPEPELALRAYHAFVERADKQSPLLGNGKNVLVVDVGGHTVDVVIMTSVYDGEKTSLVRIEENRPRSEDFNQRFPLGKYMTLHLADRLYGKRIFDPSLEVAKLQMLKSLDGLSDDEQVDIFFTSALKEKVHFTRLETAPEDKKPGETYVSLYGEDDRTSLCFGQTVEQCKGMVEACIHNGSIKIDNVLFTGGTSRIALLREEIVGLIAFEPGNNGVRPEVLLMDDVKEDADGEPFLIGTLTECAVPLSSENAVATGAAIYAMGVQNGLIDQTDEYLGGSVSMQTDDPEKARLRAECDFYKCALDRSMTDEEKLSFFAKYISLKRAMSDSPNIPPEGTELREGQRRTESITIKVPTVYPKAPKKRF